jgi:NAD(P)-dependent dehydrogenase (short-subunit alcohol dehydrogenase family)
MNIFITGANRGIGLGLVQYYLARGHEVWACYRSDRGGLAGIDNPQLHLVQWDVTHDRPTRVDGELPAKIDVLINNAGVYGASKDTNQSLKAVTPDDMHKVFDIDCLGALRVVKLLCPAVAGAKGVIANISSKMGSSADNTSGGCYAYRAAKAALVIVSKSMAVDLAPQGVRVITLHPGWVRTDMTDHSGLIDVDVSVAGMTRVIDSIDQYQPGEFVAFDGKVIPY